MVKRFISLLMLFCCVIGIKAQMDQQLPLNSKIIHGKLANGLNYYVLSNQEPKGRANFYIAQKVGSTLETKQQLGLAHFLEHMAFNGTKNFPGKNMLEYLQHNGIRFGADINAYTGFDETVYRINNVPTNNEALMDSVLLMLHDWSGSLLLEEAEIDAERGVIQEEWRQRNDAQTRTMMALAPQLYDEYQYTQTPIGTMEVVMNFPYQDLRDYYHKWYRPDQQGIVVVGDFDAKKMAEKIEKLFAEIPMPENAAERTYPTISDNKELRFASYEDPEVQQAYIVYSLKMEKTPFEQRNTLGYYLEEYLINNLVCSMINNRLGEMAQKPDCPFMMAQVNIGDYWYSKTKGALNLYVYSKDNSKAAFDTAFGELVRACRTGFTDSELARAKESFMSNLEKQYNERDKTNSHALGQEIIRTFIDNEPAPGIEAEYNLCKQFLPMINVQMLNEGVKQILKDENQVVAVVQPKKEGNVLPTRDEMALIISNNLNKQFEAYVDDVLDEPLISKMPKKGSIKSTKELPAFGATEMILSNGAKVIVKTTDFASDEILFTAVAPFGSLALDGANASNIKILPTAFEVSKLGNFNINQLEKALSGKNIGSSYALNMYSNGISGVSTRKDLESLMQIIYLQFTNVNPDEETYSAIASQYAAMLANQEKNPEKVFSKELYKTWYDGNILVQPLEAADFKSADYKKMLEIARQNLSNAADFTFIFVGNVDAATLKPLLEQYIASLPGSLKKKGKYENKNLYQAKGKVDNFFNFPMESPQIKEFVIISGNNVPYTVDNSIKLDIMGQILDMIYIRTLREEIGGTYGAAVDGSVNSRTGEWTLLYQYDTGADTKKQLEERAISDLNDLMTNGATVEDFNKCKEATLAQYELGIKKNKYWLNTLRTFATQGIDDYSEYYNALSKLTREDLNAFMKKLYDGKNRIHVTLTGVKE